MTVPVSLQSPSKDGALPTSRATLTAAQAAVPFPFKLGVASGDPARKVLMRSALAKRQRGRIARGKQEAW